MRRNGAPLRWPLLGHYAAFRADVPGFLLRIARQQGDVARFKLGRSDAWLFAHPDHVQAVLVDSAAAFRKGNLMQRARRLLGDGLLTSEGELHAAQRRRIQPVFTKQGLREYAATAPAVVARRTAHWRDGVPIRIDAEMDALAMSIVAQSLLGVDIDDEAPFVGRALHLLARWAPVLAAPGGQFLERTHLPLLGRLRGAIETIEAAIDRAIAEGGAASPLLAALMRPSNEAAAAIPKQLIRDEVMTIFLAGHDTTAAALTWTWLLLGTHLDVEMRVRAELEKNGEETDTHSLPYTEWAVRETLRLYPPIARIGRRALRDVEVGDVRLPGGAAVFVSPFVTQRDPRWFSVPDEYLPQRWAEPATDRPRFAWFPFGAGPRACVGEHFARMMMVLAISAIARQWRLVPTTMAMPKPRSLLTLKPRGPVFMVARYLG